MGKIDKNTDDYIISQIDKAINELVFPKYRLQKAYNYYNGILDAEQYRHLEENYGLGNPTSVEFIPLIKKHVDALIGEYLDIPIIPKVSCKDSKTLSNIQRDKQLMIVSEVFEFLKSHLNNSILAFIDGKNTTDSSIQYELKKLKEELDLNFTSEYEIAAQNVVEYLIQSRNINLQEKLRQLFLDLLITGTAYYKVVPTKNGKNLTIEVCHPLNTFIDRNPESNLIKDSYKTVHRKWMTKTQILNLYGEELTADDADVLESMFSGSFDTSQYYVRSFNNQPTGYAMTDGIAAGQEVVPGFPSDEYRVTSQQLIPVYDVEYILTDKSDDYTMHRYSGVRIGISIYVIREVDVNVSRSADDPSLVRTTINGVIFANRGNDAYSLVIATMALQDKYNILHFYRDNIIANSGSVGDWLDLSILPAKLGVELPERIQKWIAYKKAGVALLDSSQEGRSFNNNTTFAGFDDTIKAQTVQGIQMAIQSIEETCASITGVFRERLNGITAKDAVSNVEVGQRNSFIVTKQFFQQMDLVVAEMLTDSLNLAKIVYKKGLTGNIILGNKLQKIFTALPEHFTATDFDIHIISSSDAVKDSETMKQLSMEFARTGLVEPELLLEVATSKSTTEVKTILSRSMKKKKEENDAIKQLTQQLDQASQELKQLAEMNKKLESEVKKADVEGKKLEIQKTKMQMDVEWYKATNDAEYKKTVNEINERKVEVELAQTVDTNPNNDKVNFK